jgi:alpha-L-arabinofuranosidase
LFALAGRDGAMGDLIVKAINVAAEAVPAALTLTGVEHLAAEAEVATLTPSAPDANNSLDAPTAVVPIERRMAVPGPTLSYEFPSRSLTLIRFRTR